MSLNFCCHIQMEGFEFSVNKMKALIQAAGAVMVREIFS